MKAFGELFIDETKKGIKLQTSEYKKQGNHIIVDQGKNPIAGYTDREKGLFEDVPVIIFGDHTRVIKYVDQPFFLGADGVKILRSKDKKSNYKYLYYALRNANIPDTGYNRHFKWLKETKINYPSVARQDEIVSILDKLSDIIDRRKTQLQGLDSLIKARFVEMFGDSVDNSNEYYVATLQELLDKRYIIYHMDGNHGGDYPRNDEFVDRGVPYISANCIVNDDIDFSKAKYLTVERANKLKKGIAQDDDVLFAHNATVGPTVILHTCAEKIILGTSLTAYRCNKKYVIPYYLKFYMLSDGFVRQYSGDMKQTTRNQVPITVQKKYLFLVPPIEEQNKFADFAHQVDKSKLLSLIKLLEQLITYLYNVYIIYRQDKGEEVEDHE